MLTTFHDRINHLVAEVQRQTQVGFSVDTPGREIRIATELAEVSFPVAMACLADTQLHAILLHAAGYSYIWPETIERHLLFKDAIEAYLDVDHFAADALLSLAYALIIDRHTSDFSPSGSEYRAVMLEMRKWGFQELAAGGEGYRSSPSLRAHPEWELLTTLFHLNLFPFGVPGSKADQQTAGALLGLLFNEEREENERLLAFCKAYQELFPHSRIYYQPQNLLTTLMAMFEKLVINEHCVRPSRRSSKHGSKREAILNRIKTPTFDTELTEKVEEALLIASQHPVRDGANGLWNIGDPVAQLDLKRSFRRSPRLYPGLTTRRLPRTIVAHDRVGNRPMAPFLVIDDSGSMEDRPARFARSFGEGINRFAERMGLPIGLLTFGSAIGAFIPESNDHEEITRVLRGLDGNLGSTDFSGALDFLAEKLPRIPHIPRHFVVLSDAEFDDWRSATESISPLLRDHRVTVLLLNDEIPDELRLLSSDDSAKNLSVYHINPQKPTFQAIIKEIAQ